MDYNENTEITNGVDILTNQVRHLRTTGTGHVTDGCDVINNKTIHCSEVPQKMDIKCIVQDNSPKITMTPVRQINSPTKSPKTRSDLNLSGMMSPVTWKDFSPTREQKIVSHVNSTSSSAEGSPVKSHVSGLNKNQVMTWKDVSPTKGSCGSPTNGFVSNSISLSANENEVLRIELVEYDGKQIPERAFIASPEDNFNNDYYYDEDFTVQFDTNLRMSPLTKQPNAGKEARVTIEFPQMLTGSYLSFNNMRGSSALIEHEQILKQYGSELSASHNSAMEMSSSEREMMYSSDMLDFSNNPIFSPTPTSEVPSHNVSTDSLDKTSRCHMLGMSNSLSSFEGNLGVTCCPKKEEYFLSFETSQSNARMSDIETSLGSGPIYWKESQSSGLSGEDLQEESSDSFQFCYTSSSDTGSKGNKRYVRDLGSHGCGMGTLVEQTVEKSPTDENIQSKGNSVMSPLSGPKINSMLSPVRRPKKTHSAYRKPESNNLTSPKNCLSLPFTETVSQLSRPKNLMSWQKVESLRRLGCLNVVDKLQSCSMPNLPLQTWQSVVQTNHRRKISDVASSFHSKRHSASLLELYQRLRCNSIPTSPETIHNVEQILFNPNCGQLCFHDVLEEKFIHACEKALKIVNNKEVNRSNSTSSGSSSSFGDSTLKALEWRQLNRLQYKDANSQSEQLNVQFSKETVISPETVTLWGGTKNVGSQFPPNTRDCAIQTSVDIAKTSESFKEGKGKCYDRAQQTSLECTKQELLSTLPENFASLEELLNKIDHKPNMRRHSTCPSELFEKNGNRLQSADRPQTSCVSSPCLSVSRSLFYSHRSLPDLSFLSSSSSSSVVKDLKMSLFDPMQIPVPVFVRPKIEIDVHHGICYHSLHGETTHVSRREANCLSKCHCRSKSAPPKMHGHHLVRNCAESTSSSSGISMSSSSSGIDAGYSDSCKCHNTSPSDLERLLFFPPHVENTPQMINTNPIADDNEPTVTGSILRSKLKYDQYAFEVYPGTGDNVTKGKVQTRKKENCVSSSSSSSSVHLENLYSLKEEKTPEASPEKTRDNDNKQTRPLTNCYGNLCRRRWSENFTDSDHCNLEMHDLLHCQSTEYLQQFCFDRSSIPHYDKKPLKSCLRKTTQAFKSRSMSDPFNLNLEHEEIKNRKRHSYACDDVYILPDETGCMVSDDSENRADPVMFYVDQNGDCHMTEDVGVVKSNDTVETDDSDKEASNKRKSVSFASEVSFHAISPQTSPKRQVDNNNLTLDLQNNSSNGERILCIHHVSERDGDSDNSSASSDSPPSEFQVNVTKSDRATVHMEDLSRKTVIVKDISQAAEALVRHFNTAKDPFDKLRLGSTADTPEVGDLVLTHLCLSVAQLIGDGLKPYLDGVHVFGRVQITLWKVAEASAELNPYTSAIHDLVKQLKDKSGFPTTRVKFDAFIAGLLNLRLLDFWMGYIRNKDTITGRFYEQDSILLLSQTVLQQSYNDMLLSIQPLAVLPFHLQFDFILGKMTNSDRQSNNDSKMDEKFEQKSKTRSLTVSAEKALHWLSGTFPRVKKSDSKLIPPDMVTSLSSSVISTSTDKIMHTSMSGSTQEVFTRDGNELLLTKLFLSQQSESIKPKALPINTDSSERDMATSSETLSPVSLLARKWFGFGSTKKATYTKGITEKSCGSERRGVNAEAFNRNGNSQLTGRTCHLNTGMGLITVGEIAPPPTSNNTQNMEEDSTEVKTNFLGNRKVLGEDSHQFSGIIGLFDRLLLPKDRSEDKHPLRKRWSWSLGMKSRENVLKSKQINNSLLPLPGKIQANTDIIPCKENKVTNTSAGRECSKLPTDADTSPEDKQGHAAKKTDTCEEVIKATNSMSLENGNVVYCPQNVMPRRLSDNTASCDHVGTTAVLNTPHLQYGKLDINCNSQTVSIQQQAATLSSNHPTKIDPKGIIFLGNAGDKSSEQTCQADVKDEQQINLLT